MVRFAYEPRNLRSVKAYGRALRLSTKNSVGVCRTLTGMNLQKGKKLLEDLSSERRSLNGKHYTKISSELLNLLKSAEANAEFKGLDTERLIIHVTAHKAFRYYRPRRFKMRREKRKLTNIQLVLEQK